MQLSADGSPYKVCFRETEKGDVSLIFSLESEKGGNPWKAIIVDESHYIKDPKSKRSGGKVEPNSFGW